MFKNLKAIPDNPANYVILFSDDKNVKNQIKKLVKVAKFFLDVIFVMEDHMMGLVQKVMMERE